MFRNFSSCPRLQNPNIVSFLSLEASNVYQENNPTAAHYNRQKKPFHKTKQKL
jgi:hypothetical protein